MSVLTDETRRAIEHDCTALMHRYAVNADHHIDRFFEVFAQDAIWVRPGGEMHGHAAIQKFMDDYVVATVAATGHGPLTRHLMTTIRIDVRDEHSADGVIYGLVFRDENFAGTLPVPMNTIELVAEYRTSFRKTAQGWRISRHEAHHVFRR